MNTKHPLFNLSFNARAGAMIKGWPSLDKQPGREGCFDWSDGIQTVKTPLALVIEVLQKVEIEKIQKAKRIIVLFNPEFILPLVVLFKVDINKIVFVCDVPNKEKLVKLDGKSPVIFTLPQEQQQEKDMVETMVSDLYKAFPGGFDVIVGNPPYQNENTSSLYADIVLQFAKQSPQAELCFIIPGVWLTKLQTETDKHSSLKRALVNHGLKSIDYFDKDDAAAKFNWPTIPGGVCFFTAGPEAGSIEVNNRTFGHKILISQHDIKNIPNIPLNTIDTSIIASVCAKTKSEKTVDKIHNRGKIKSNTISTGGPVKCYLSKGRSSSRREIFVDAIGVPHVDTVKCSFSYYCQTSLHDFLVVDKGEICSESFMYFNFDTVGQCNNFASYSRTVLFRFLRRLVTLNFAASSKTFQLIPVIDFNRSWDDLSVNSLFGITDEEYHAMSEFVNLPENFS